MLLGGAGLALAAAAYQWATTLPQRDRMPTPRPTAIAVAVAPAKRVEATPYAPPSDVTAEVKALDWFQFEKFVELLFVQQGYRVERSGGANPDGGIDMMLHKGGVTEAVQCKHWKVYKVGVKELREFLGALTDRGVARGIFVTLQPYTDEARALAAKHQITLVGEPEFKQMLEAVSWATNPALINLLRDKQKYCPKCEAEMVLRTAKKGKAVGSQFWSCSTFPRCRERLVYAG